MSEFIDKDGVVYSWSEARGRIRSCGDGSRVVRGKVVYEESKTLQSAADEADLNWLVKRWAGGRAMPETVPGSYGDVSERVSYVDVVERLKVVSDHFMQLPPNLREYFYNDATRFADFVADERNIAEGVEIGLYAPRTDEVQEGAPAEGTPPPAAS